MPKTSIKLPLISLVMLLTLFFTTTPSFATTQPDSNLPLIYADQVLVKVTQNQQRLLRSGAPVNRIPDKALRQMLEHAQARAIKSLTPPHHPLNQWYLISLGLDHHPLIHPSSPSDHFPDTILPQVAQLIADLNQHPDVIIAEPNFVVSIAATPNDPFYPTSGSWGQSYKDLYGLHKLDLESTWDLTTGNPQVIVADIDTGLDFTHPDIIDNIWTNPDEIPKNGVDDDFNGYIDDVHGWDWVDNDNDPTDLHGHGTHTAGTIAATGDNNLGVVGVTWHTPIMPLRFLDAKGQGSTNNAALAIIYAVDNGAAISSNSWGCSGCYSSLLDDTIAYAHASGVTTIVAAGNSNTDALESSPANSHHAITIAATDPNNNKASFSNFGPKIDVAAPGVNTLSLRANLGTMCNSTNTVDSNYCFVSGTSMATPHAAGLAALLKSLYPSTSPEQLRQMLRLGANDLGSPGIDTQFGHGLIRASTTSNLNPDQLLTPQFISPLNHTTLTSATIPIIGTADGNQFSSYILEYGAGRAPTSWTLLTISSSPVTNGPLGSFTSSSLTDGLYTLRLTAIDTSAQAYQTQSFDLQVKNFTATITSPDQVVYGGTVSIIGTAKTLNTTPFDHFTLEYGLGKNPTSWITNGITRSNDGFIPITDDVLGTWNTNGLDNNKSYTLRLTVYSTDGRQAIDSAYLASDTQNLPGWPKYFPTSSGISFNSVPIFANITGDADLEIIFAPVNSKTIYAYTKSGANVEGWPTTLPFPNQSSKPAAADLNGDNLADILLHTTNREIYVLKHDGQVLSGWPRTLPNTVSTPSVADLDADGSPEVVAMVETWNNKTLYVYAFHADGSPVEGFPATVFTSSPTTLTSYTNFELSLKDLNHDGYVEIILNSPANNFNQVYILDHTGQSLPGWPQTIDGYRVLQVYAADMTGDAKENIIVYYMANNISGSTAKIAVYDLAGEILPNYPQIAANQVARMGLGIADVTQDGIPDIVLPHYGVGSTQFACSPSVFTQSGIFPYPINCYHGNDVPPAIADFDADDIPEVIVSSISQAKIYILQQQIDNSGKMGWYSTWEKSISDSFTQPIVADIDHNGHYEIMTVATNSQTTSDGTLLLWEPTDITNTAGIDSWPQYRHDAAHTSLYSHQISLLTPSPASPPAPGDANFDGHVDILDYSVIISNFGIDSSPNCSTRPPGDIAPYPDGNCVVDILDYSLVISTFGSN